MTLELKQKVKFKHFEDKLWRVFSPSFCPRSLKIYTIIMLEKLYLAIIFVLKFVIYVRVTKIMYILFNPIMRIQELFLQAVTQLELQA